jgi:hypothetical protein
MPWGFSLDGWTLARVGGRPVRSAPARAGALARADASGRFGRERKNFSRIRKTENLEIKIWKRINVWSLGIRICRRTERSGVRSGSCTAPASLRSAPE